MRTRVRPVTSPLRRPTGATRHASPRRRAGRPATKWGRSAPLGTWARGWQAFPVSKGVGPLRPSAIDFAFRHEKGAWRLQR